MTWTLSVDVFQLRVSPLWVTLEAASPLGVEGACVSVAGGGGEQALVEVVRVAREERLPAASRASTAKV